MAESKESSAKASTGAPLDLASSDADAFSMTYWEARLKFLDAALTVPGASVVSFRVGGASKKTSQGADKESLYIDFAVIRGSAAQCVKEGRPVSKEAEATQRLMVHACGVKGVDGFAGSGIQVALLHDLANASDGSTLSAEELGPGDVIIFAHALNPYGFSWWRLCNGIGKGVDLSRNFVTHYGSTFPSASSFAFLAKNHNTSFSAERDKVPSEACCGSFDTRKGHLKRLAELSTAGQYVDPAGMHYGGVELQQESAITLDVLWDMGLRPDNSHLEALGVVQVTAGGGKHGEEHIVAEHVDMQRELHALGLGHLATAEESLIGHIEDVAAAARDFVSAQDDAGDDVGDDHTVLYAADSELYPNNLTGSLISALARQAPVTDRGKSLAAKQRAVAADFEAPQAVAAGFAIAVPDSAGYLPAQPPPEACAALADTPGATSDGSLRRVGAGRWTSAVNTSEGCPTQFLAIQHFCTSPSSKVHAATRREHAEVSAKRDLQLFSDSRMELREAHFVDTAKWRLQTLHRGKRFFQLMARRVFASRRGQAGKGAAAAEPGHVEVEVQ